MKILIFCEVLKNGARFARKDLLERLGVRWSGSSSKKSIDRQAGIRNPLPKTSHIPPLASFRANPPINNACGGVGVYFPTYSGGK